MGNHKKIASPEILWEMFKHFRTEKKKDTILVVDFVGKDGKKVNKPFQRPLTLDGFESWCFEKVIINDLGDYFSNKGKRYSKFATICSHIRKIIRTDQIEGGMAGIYNPSITQRLNGLVEKIQEDGNKEVTIKVKYEQRKNNNPQSAAQESAEDN